MTGRPNARPTPAPLRHLALALALPALLALAPGCGGSAAESTTLDSLKQVSIRTLDGLIAGFKPQALPATVPDPAIDVESREVIDQGYLDLAFVGKGKVFETKPDGALIYYTRLNTTGRFTALVVAIQKPDGMHYHLCTLSPEGKPIDQKEIAFSILGDKFDSQRTATITADLRVLMVERSKTFTVLTPEQAAALRTNSVVRETKGERNESFQISPEGKISEAGWQRPGEPARADSAAR